MSEKRIIMVEKCQTCPFSAWKNINNAQETYLECQHPEIPQRRFPKMSHTSPPRWCPLDQLTGYVDILRSSKQQKGAKKT